MHSISHYHYVHILGAAIQGALSNHAMTKTDLEDVYMVGTVTARVAQGVQQGLANAGIVIEMENP